MITTTVLLAPPVETTFTTRPSATISSGPVLPAHYGPMAIEESIRHRAYFKWVARGRPQGDGVTFWLAAEQEILLGK